MADIFHASHTWGPLEHPEEHNVKPIAASGAEGAVTEPHHTGREAEPRPTENYNATDGRHNKADHQGWPTVDVHSGGDVDEHGKARKRFPDGPGPWRQT